MQAFSSSVLKNTPLDLRPEHLALVQAILRAHVPSYTVWAFGSRTQGTAKPMSDLDLAVVGVDPDDARSLGNLREAFEESDLPMKVDVLDWTQTDGKFQRIIEVQKVSVQNVR